ncbi:hypothetical protein [Uliginosibacterium sediminicola]|uniref:Nickel transport protein n=1 Tax=Uliginosibacterium sediminicola TaxID=2024550 RepID=A0ABU9Z401_9RHOO
MRVFLLMLIAALAPAVLAHNGEDHGDAPVAQAQTASPRFEARSELFEVLGLLQAQQLIVYIDRSESNAPVANALIEIESGSFKASARSDADGIARLPAGPLTQPGQHALILSLSAGEESDLLSASFTPGAADNASPSTTPSASPRRAILLAGSGVLVLIAAGVLVVLIKRRAA